MHIHILGICGTFMGGLAIIARQLGHKVTGSDANVYPPMSTQLESQGISLYQGYDPSQFDDRPDLVVVGNAMSRGNPAVEYMLNEDIAYTSGPQWLADHVLCDRWVLAVSGTHGKTTTSSMLAWIMEDNGLHPGFLIGGVPANFGLSASAGESPFFVIEADEYDSAFFDKRSKFVHYRPRTLVMNNLEFDHADIFDDVVAIQKQFHHLIRTVPAQGRIIYPAGEPLLDEVLEQGCWSPVERLGDANDWQAKLLKADGSHFQVLYAGEAYGEVEWTQLGNHSVTNALAAIAASVHAGVAPAAAVASLCEFKGVKRRMELIGKVNDIRVYDDFAHHPTAIATTLAGLRASNPAGKIIAILEPRSNTMRMGVHRDELALSASDADKAFWLQGRDMDWALDAVIDGNAGQQVCQSVEEIIDAVRDCSNPGDVILIMSNGSFDGIYQKLLDALAA
ncbi:MAG: UDP-N-acetylmuramate:L-alanyl-gamma-D-glutamyl-meso-diaminopimelate ligase [Pseudomonadales bacterium]